MGEGDQTDLPPPTPSPPPRLLAVFWAFFLFKDFGRSPLLEEGGSLISAPAFTFQFFPPPPACPSPVMRFSMWGGGTGGSFLSFLSHLTKCCAGRGEQERGLVLHLLIPVPINCFPAIPGLLVFFSQLPLCHGSFSPPPPLAPSPPHTPTHVPDSWAGCWFRKPSQPFLRRLTPFHPGLEGGHAPPNYYGSAE